VKGGREEGREGREGEGTEEVRLCVSEGEMPEGREGGGRKGGRGGGREGGRVSPGSWGPGTKMKVASAQRVGASCLRREDKPSK